MPAAWGLILAAAAALVGCHTSSATGAPEHDALVSTHAQPPPLEATVDLPDAADGDAPESGAADAAPATEASASDVARASNLFAWDLYAKLRAGGGNFVLSPASIAIALAMTAAGARGETFAQMARVLHVDRLPGADLGFARLLAALNARDGKSGVRLHIADRVWTQQGMHVEAAFTDLLAGPYLAPLAPADFAGDFEAARGAINAWVAGETHDRIPVLVPKGAIDRATRMVLVNAVYFKGRWQHRFEPTSTIDGSFATAAGPVTTKMMKQTLTARYAPVHDAQVVELPYAGGLSMVIVLPDAQQGLAAIEPRVQRELPEWLRHLYAMPVDVELPRWTSRWGAMVDGALKALGMPLAFDDADFSGITGDKQLSIFHVITQAFVDVNEEGSEAAAGTAVLMGQHPSASRPPPNPIFRADHPFVYAIRDSATGLLLFVGRVTDPRY